MKIEKPGVYIAIKEFRVYTESKGFCMIPENMFLNVTQIMTEYPYKWLCKELLDWVQMDDVPVELLKEKE